MSKPKNDLCGPCFGQTIAIDFIINPNPWRLVRRAGLKLVFASPNLIIPSFEKDFK